MDDVSPDHGREIKVARRFASGVLGVRMLRLRGRAWKDRGLGKSALPDCWCYDGMNVGWKGRLELGLRGENHVKEKSASESVGSYDLTRRKSSEVDMTVVEVWCTPLFQLQESHDRCRIKL